MLMQYVHSQLGSRADKARVDGATKSSRTKAGTLLDLFHDFLATHHGAKATSAASLQPRCFGVRGFALCRFVATDALLDIGPKDIRIAADGRHA